MRIFHKLLIAAIMVLTTGFGSWGQQLAFPGAEGYGRFASGGRGDNSFLTPKVVAVTNLEDNAEGEALIEGSFRWALAQQDTLYNNVTLKIPTTIIFKVGGVIMLKQDIKCKTKNLTIAGQTAPGGGICFGGGTLNFSGSSNIIVRYIRSRPGDVSGDEVSAFRIENGGNFIIDHCTFSWAIEETTHFSSNENTSVQWCIISESLFHSIHKKGDRGYGTQWGGEYASYHHNLLAHHNSRMPRINGSNKNDIEALVDYRNNVNFNWGSSGAFYGGEWEGTSGKGFCATNVVNNYFKPGPATSGEYFARPSSNRSGVQFDGYAQWYFSGNIMEGNEQRSNDNWLGVDGSNVGGIANIRSEVEAVKADGSLEKYERYSQSASDAYTDVLAHAGASLPQRDAHDQRLVKEVSGEVDIVRYEYTTNDGQETPKKGVASGLIDTQNNLVPSDAPEGTTAWSVYESVGSEQSPADSDGDGLPDAWETSNDLDPADPTDFMTITASGYSYLEIYLNELTGVEIDAADSVKYNDVVTSISQLKKRPGLNVYPNPAVDMLYIQGGQNIVKLEVYSLSGIRMMESVNHDGIRELNVARLNSGIYFVKATAGNGEIYQTKLLKQ
ncbi:T9SS type A sorting domain-containing protein [Roseimarinus sediminis]|uniref:T9SS type A sorting domain-containing protein n=1 Tax=Roseimarinus sediminis TaxID=1610899 RepID=UPI003D25FAAE